MIRVCPTLGVDKETNELVTDEQILGEHEAALSPLNRIEWYYIVPGNPFRNSFVESINGRMHDDLLMESKFRNLARTSI